jgi:hypothetical protein
MPPTTNNLAGQYNIFASCNKRGGTHQIEHSFILKDGPLKRQTIGLAYKDKNLPESLAKLSSKNTTCPTTGRGFTQKDKYQIF